MRTDAATDPYRAPQHLERASGTERGRIGIAVGLSAWCGLAVAVLLLALDGEFRGVHSYFGPDAEAHMARFLWQENVASSFTYYLLLSLVSSPALVAITRAVFGRCFARRPLPVDFGSTAFAVLVVLFTLGRFLVRVATYA